jgi:hypothetical protein
MDGLYEQIAAVPILTGGIINNYCGYNPTYAKHLDATTLVALISLPASTDLTDPSNEAGILFLRLQANSSTLLSNLQALIDRMIILILLADSDPIQAIVCSICCLTVFAAVRSVDLLLFCRPWLKKIM